MSFSNMYSWLYHIMQKLTVEEYDKRLPMYQHLPTTGSHLQEPYYHIIACMEITKLSKILLVNFLGMVIC